MDYGNVAHNMNRSRPGDRLPHFYYRDQETEHMLELLGGSERKHILIVGQPGVGKSAFVEHVARRLSQVARNHPLYGYRILQLNVELLTSPTVANQEKVAKLAKTLKSKPNHILFSEAIAPLFQMDFHSFTGASKLFELVTSNVVTCITTATPDELEKTEDEEGLPVADFQRLELKPLSVEDTKDILRRYQDTLEARYEIKIGDNAISQAIALTEKYLPNQALPGKAIDVLDQACARYKGKLVAQENVPQDMLDAATMKYLGNEVGSHDVKRVVSELTSIDVVAKEKHAWAEELQARLSRAVIGQPEAMRALAEAIRKIRSSFNKSRSRPAGVLLLTGPPGVGKVYSITALVNQLFGSDECLQIVDMGQFADASTAENWIGVDDGSNDPKSGRLVLSRILETPMPFVVLDSVEECHPTALNALMTLLLRGHIRHLNGTKIDFRRCVIVFTVNTLVDAVPGGAPVFSGGSLNLPAFVTEHLDASIPFEALSDRDATEIARRILRRSLRPLLRSEVNIKVHPALIDEIVAQGYGQAYGVESMPGAVQNLIITPVSEAIQGDELERNDTLEITTESGTVHARIRRTSDQARR